MERAIDTPLASRQLFQSFDLDEARAIVAKKFCEHRLERDRSSDRFDALHNHVAGREVSLNYLRYGADVTIEPGELTSFYLLQIPIRGVAEIVCGGDHVISDASRASLLNPQRHTSMRWSGACEQLLVQIDRAALETMAEEFIGRSLPLDLVFDSAVDIGRPEVRAWVRNLFGLFCAAERGAAFASPGSVSQIAIEREIMEGVLRLQPNSLSHRLTRAPQPIARAATVRAAIALIRGAPLATASISEIAKAVGVGERALQIAFRKETGLSPKQFLTRERLINAHEDIVSSAGAAQIGEVAKKWGFAHAGRFASAYRKQFGDFPKTVAGRFRR